MAIRVGPEVVVVFLESEHDPSAELHPTRDTFR
jgi:hypothetical protein